MSVINRLLSLWLSIWLYGMAVAGTVLVIVLATGWNGFGWEHRLGLMGVIALTMHMWEEERIPGGFAYMMNTMQGSDMPDRYPMSDLVAMLVDCCGVTVMLFILFLGHGADWAAIAIACIGITEAAIHTVAGFALRRKYAAQGKRTIYDPGLITALFAFLPTSIATFTYAARSSTTTDWIIGILTAIAILSINVKGLETLLKDRNTPYPIPEQHVKGYFAKYTR
ncbi:HXXEE domain-containing protein [Bifidobacterium sp. 82T24]|uniref:HXXEE domain-containing protein n=1 Tax=Bifidobacterium pluvialisilvae TaxID=2834436 RepID=UPI001C566EAB|nr:HXXEE domain-containing protein [Bifidobacterium pluvialisilvae]MBW3088149.1 HXXEE domain-containing protein [Bifidobacterium pluvialisilvae]